MASAQTPPPPEVSVIMPARNAEKTVAASVRSVLAQTYRDFELLVIDDESGDATGALVSGLLAGLPNALYYRLDKRGGRAFARNFGVSLAKGKWIAFLDSDDLWREDKLQRHMRFIHKTNAAISYTASAFINPAGKPYKYVMRAKYILTYKELLRRNLMSLSSVIVRRDIMSRVKMADGELHEDYAAWLEILRETGRAYGLDEPLLTYRISGSSTSGNRLKSAQMVFNTYKYVGYKTVPAFLLTLRYAVHSVRKRLRIYAS
ncbi:MAG: glycosyltransferase [Firmicutes bacterium]|nr:glycosyltransferase [Bacillota bacterium]